MSKNDDLSVIKRQFLASLNHEIRTPLSGILGMTDLLLETTLSIDQKEYVESARVCAENLLQILNGALEFTALAGNVSVEETEFHLRETLESVAAEFVAKAESIRLKLIRNFDSRLPDAVVGDPLRLRQLLVALMANAVKFTHQGEVELGAFGQKRDHNSFLLRVVVRDTGIGIPPDRVRSIFEEFQRLHNGPASDHNGLGLGLAVSQKLATLLNGTITVESELHRGSIFSVDIPLRMPVESSIPPVESRPRRRILVVDDNSIAQTIASHALRRHSYEVHIAGDGETALEAAASSVFDLILLDLQMPGLDGFQTAERLRQMPEYVETPIVAVTANCSEDYRDRCREYGMQGFLAKPVRTKDLVQTVQQYCAPATLAS